LLLTRAPLLAQLALEAVTWLYEEHLFAHCVVHRHFRLAGLLPALIALLVEHPRLQECLLVPNGE
jgi:hypothetical protein